MNTVFCDVCHQRGCPGGAVCRRNLQALLDRTALHRPNNKDGERQRDRGHLHAPNGLLVAVLVFLLWVLGQMFVGEPGLPEPPAVPNHTQYAPQPPVQP